MGDNFQRLFMMSEPQPLSLNAQAALGAVRAPHRSQFSHLLRHFLERFFNHETASPDGDSKARLVLAALATGLPGFVVALYLWPVYHPIRGWPPGLSSSGDPPPYWLRVDHHLFYVLYSFVAMGIVTVFEWDLFFPDLLDVFILQTLPIGERRAFMARVAAIAIFIGGFLFDANIMALLVLPAATDPPNLARFLAGHLLSVAASGLFAATFILALQGLLLTLLGERLFRKISLLLQGLFITLLLMLLLLFPVLSRAVPLLLESGNPLVLCFPPFWFLGIYQCLVDGNSELPIFARLAETGCAALLLVVSIALLTYPFAYLRRTRQLVEGPGVRCRPSRLARPLDRLLHFTFVRPPLRRAVFHFINQTLLRLPRYRIYLVLYGGVGVSIVAANILRLTVADHHLAFQTSPDGIRAATAIVAFWMIAGLRMALVSPGNRQGSWIFPIIQGNPPRFTAALHQLSAARIWVLLWSLIVTLGTYFVLRPLSPPQLLAMPASAAQILVAAALCLLLTDIFFLNVTSIAFTGQPSRQQPNPALAVLKYIAALSFIAWLPLAVEPWIEHSVGHLLLAASAVAAANLALQFRHRSNVHLHCGQPALEDDEEDFPMKLGLRY